MANVVLLSATSIAQAIPDRFWLPAAEALAGLSGQSAWVKLEAVEVDDDGGADLNTMTPLWIDLDAVAGDELRGTVASGQVDHPGYEKGAALTVRFDQVFDVRRFDADGAPVLNVERAEYARGKTVLVGITRLSPTGELRAQEQFAGRLAEIDPDNGLLLDVGADEPHWLPPDMGPWEVAAPGEYRLRSTGETLVDPDYLCTWVLTEPE
jgi:hypothetical protein